MTVLLIDGRSGSGKTELARAIVALRPDVQLVRLDDIYPGWDGLEAASLYVHEVLLATGKWQRWDWKRYEKAEWHEIDLTRSLIVEGCGVLSQVNCSLADYAVWVEFPPRGRHDRAIARDPGYVEFWERWARQEEEFIAREHPELYANEVLDGKNVIDQAERFAAMIEQ